MKNTTGQKKALQEVGNDLRETINIGGYVYYYQNFINRRDFLYILDEKGVKANLDPTLMRGFKEVKRDHDDIIHLFETAKMNKGIDFQVSQFQSSIEFYTKKGKRFSFILAYKGKEEYMIDRECGRNKEVEFIKREGKDCG